MQSEDQEMKPSELKSSPQDQNGKYLILQIVKILGEHMSLVLRKPVLGISDQVAHKHGCSATEDG